MGELFDTYVAPAVSLGLAAYFTDFHAEDGDRIDLRAIDADTSLPGDQAFTYVGAAQFTAPGQLRARLIANDTLVEVDIDGGGADMRLVVGSNQLIDANAFFL